MSLRGRLLQWANRLLTGLDLALVPQADLARYRLTCERFRALCSRLRTRDQELFELPALSDSEQGSSLHPNHPDLVALRDSYRRTGHAVTDTHQWSDDFLRRELDMSRFRGDFAYVWQWRDLNTELHYLATAQYVQTVDTLRLMDVLTEDEAFGARTVTYGSRLISRDLLDSVIEINYLHRHLDIASRSDYIHLDLGAGYGRLAHRLCGALPNLRQVICADAIPESTFICDFYIGFRELRDRAQSVPLPALDEVLTEFPPVVATNIHSFSECTLKAIQGWMAVLARHHVPHLLIVPNALSNGGTQLLTTEPSGRREDFLPVVEDAGYVLRHCTPKYEEPLLQCHGITPTHYWLFDLQD